MGDNVSVRALRESDLPEWLRLRRMLWDQSTEDDQMTEMASIIQSPDTQFVAVAASGDDRLCAFLEASIRTHVEDCETDHVGYLEGWFVESDFRLQGIGARMVELAEQWARGRGCTEMASDAEIDNLASLKAHERLGYEETSRLVHLRKEL